MALNAAAALNPCSNGSFEALNPDGSPVDWEILNQGRIVTDDVHSGHRALRLVRPAGDPLPETGLNRRWTAKSGQQGAMIGQTKGGMEFWYKAISATTDNLYFLVIPMNGTAYEETSASRTEFVVPKAHVGDGQWHRGRLKYNYTANPRVKWVHFAVRILGGAGEMIADDIAYLDAVGPILAIDRFRLEESRERPGECCTLYAVLENKGDAPAPDVRVRLEAAQPLKVSPEERNVGALAPDAKQKLAWEITGPRTDLGDFVVHASCPGEETSARETYAPRLTLINFGPVAPVCLLGEAVTLECLIRNEGHATVVNPTAAFDFPGGEKTVSGRDLPPGASTVLRTEFRPEKETHALLAGLTLTADNADGPAKAGTRLVVGSAAPLPAPNDGPRGAVTKSWALAETMTVRLAFRRNSFGFGPGELSVRRHGPWETVGWLPTLSALSYRDDHDQNHTHTVLPSAASSEDGSGVTFTWSYEDEDGAQWQARLSFTRGPNPDSLAADYEISCDRDRRLLRFDGPLLYALDRDEAVFPGVEWLVGDEVSSSTLDIEEGHPHQVRYVPHPNMVTIPAIGIHGRAGAIGLLWKVPVPGETDRERPAAVFASPDRFNGQRAHLFGLQLPSVPKYLAPNTRIADNPYPLRANQLLKLGCVIYASGAAPDALAAMDAWFDIYGIPQPSALPHGSYENEIAFSMRAYFESLWDAQTKQWWTSKNGHPLMTYKERPPGYVADLFLGSLLSPSPEGKAQCRARAEEMARLMGFEPRLDALRGAGRTDFGAADGSLIATLLAARSTDGLWRFDADREDTGIFKGFDYHTLGENNAVALGTCTESVRQVLRYARIAGDEDAYKAVVNVLEYMETCPVPRAAQVWEVPFHSPDVLAAAYAVSAYLDAYRFSGDQRWLRDAVMWARRGLPFIYFWNDPDKPYMLGGSIPAYGASLRRYSWFGRIVQWNGLCLANAYLDLASFDTSRPWGHVARMIIHSALHQQAADGEDVALWPDSISAIEGDKSAWVFAPRQILAGITKILGRDEEPRTVILGKRPERLHVSAIGTISNAAWKDNTVSLSITYPEGEEGIVLVANVSRPQRVLLDDAPVGERTDIGKGTDPGWFYDPLGFLEIRVAKFGKTVVRVEGARYVHVNHLPPPASAIDFGFDNSEEGWQPLHDISDMAARDGMLTGRITGGDPFLARSMLTVAPDMYQAVEVRMRVSAGSGGQFYWSTAASPDFAEDRVVLFDLVADGEFHVYRIDLAKHLQWAGQKITAIRLDPGNGAAAAEFAIDYIRGLRQ
jgi:hypothetical protein